MLCISIVKVRICLLQNLQVQLFKLQNDVNSAWLHILPSLDRCDLRTLVEGGHEAFLPHILAPKPTI